MSDCPRAQIPSAQVSDKVLSICGFQPDSALGTGTIQQGHHMNPQGRTQGKPYGREESRGSGCILYPGSKRQRAGADGTVFYFPFSIQGPGWAEGAQGGGSETVSGTASPCPSDLPRSDIWRRGLLFQPKPSTLCLTSRHEAAPTPSPDLCCTWRKNFRGFPL